MIFSLFLSACGLKKLMPEGPVLQPWERTLRFAPQGAKVTYTGEARVSYPVLPLQVWGVSYDLDIVLVSQHPDWNMHEYALLQTPDGPKWIAKDAKEPTLDQSIVANIDDIDQWWPELPVPRKSAPLDVVDRSTEELLDLEFRYENIDGEPVEVTFVSKPPHSMMNKRNGSTMGHSKDRVMAVLDLSHRDFAKKATISINNKKVPMKRLLGLVPFGMILQQTQGGLAIGEYSQQSHNDSFATTHAMESGSQVTNSWQIEGRPGTVEVWQYSKIRSLKYRFVESGSSLELAAMTSWQWGRETPTTHVEISPPLPDLRRPFEGQHTSHFVIDINGQPNLAVGRLEARWEGDKAVLECFGESPWWVADRPMRSTITYDDQTTKVLIERLHVAAPAAVRSVTSVGQKPK
ncbi:MAG: hypothetical protein HN348_06840 [Proteobacteria bacterium]|nr:hypothetical protein [Pseudomonadota bacterium]